MEYLVKHYIVEMLLDHLTKECSVKDASYLGPLGMDMVVAKQSLVHGKWLSVET